MTNNFKSLFFSAKGKTAALFIASAIAAVAIAIALPLSQANADVITSDEKWTVTFSSAQKMESNFDSEDITEFVGTMQPGDTAEISVTLKNEYSKTTSWYMTNKVISSLEESAESANGGAYTYELVYTAPDGKTETLFSSDTVGGDNSAGTDSGLHEATGALSDYFLLGTIGTNKTAQVDLSVSLDGETQGNSYQDTLADLSLDFAVEPEDSEDTDTPTTTTTTTNTPNDGPPTGRLQQTGDTNLPIIALCSAAGVLGVILLVIAIIGRRRGNKGEGEAR